MTPGLVLRFFSFPPGVRYGPENDHCVNTTQVAGLSPADPKRRGNRGRIQGMRP